LCTGDGIDAVRQFAQHSGLDFANWLCDSGNRQVLRVFKSPTIYLVEPGIRRIAFAASGDAATEALEARLNTNVGQ
jgi:hypothetical protein